MNKKRLSVVMAGAMLASSVAPVMAAQAKNKALNGETTALKINWDNLLVKNESVSAKDAKYELDTRAEKKYEVNGSNRGELVKELRELMLSKVYSDIAANKTGVVKGITLSDDKTNQNKTFANESAYMVYVLKADKTFKAFTKVGENDIKLMEREVNNAVKGDTIFVIDRGHAVEKGLVYKMNQSNIAKKHIWTAPELEALGNLDFTNASVKNQYPAINEFIWDGKELTVVTRNSKDELECEKTTVKPGDEALDYKKPLNEQGGSLAGFAWDNEGIWETLTGFEAKLDETAGSVGQIIDANLLASVTITNVTDREVVKLSDLYDGLFLTTKGNELLEALKYDYKAISSTPAPNSPVGLAQENIKAAFVAGNYEVTLGEVASTVKKDKNGVYTLDIAFNTYDRNADKTRNNSELLDSRVITVSSNNKDQLDLFRVWMHNRRPQVDILAGDDRYETAVKIAKNNANITDVAENGNIVLVNGKALVDGLAAAPLAASVWNKDDAGVNSNTSKVAPILLTESDSIPKATADYMKELIAEQKFGQMDKVTVYLVGGESVISPAIERQLKDFGLRVVRAGGANREETSLKVAEVMAKDANRTESGTTKVDMTHAFVVGAEGEADAMSIAAVAARKGNPIIVEAKKGLTEDALDEITKWKHDYPTLTGKKLSATIVGGEDVVSKSTVKKLQAKDVAVDRVFGSNRQKTNAAVINRFYTTEGVNHVVVSKDGSNNRKSDLIDALTATSLSVQHKAPIVLGTKKLDKDQIGALERKGNRTGVYVYQVGHGVATDVIRTIANRLSLSK